MKDNPWMDDCVQDEHVYLIWGTNMHLNRNNKPLINSKLNEVNETCSFYFISGIAIQLKANN
jgi:hypothetical protein